LKKSARAHKLAFAFFILLACTILLIIFYTSTSSIPATNDTGAVELRPTIVTTSSDLNGLEPTSSRKIAADTFGNLFVVYYDGTTVRVAKSSDGGVSWNSTWECPHDQAISVGSVSFDVDPAIATDSKGNLHVVYNIWDAVDYFSGPGNNHAIYRMWNATTQAWEQERTLSTGTTSSSPMDTSPSIFVDNTDVPHIIWQESAGPDASYEGLWYTKFVGYWTNPVAIAYHSICRGPSMAVDSNGRVCVAFHAYDSQDSGYQLRIASSNSSSWHEEIVFDPPSGVECSMDTCIAIDSDNIIHVTMPMGYSPQDICVQYIRQTANGWTQPMNLTAGFSQTIYVDLPRIIVVNSGFNFPLWLCESNDSGETWSTEQIMPPRDPGGFAPGLAYYGRWVGDDRVVDLVWVDTSYNPASPNLNKIMHATINLYSPALNPTPSIPEFPIPTALPLTVVITGLLLLCIRRRLDSASCE
jgi:hypothetical protein